MGVLTGRFPGKVEDTASDRFLQRLVELLRSFFRFAESYGVAVAEREFEARKIGRGGAG
ncbi:MAG: hypothetical protein K6T80_04025 [Firmicutes bacterium]|nr:hypothetical protein [Bacillota bacterium]